MTDQWDTTDYGGNREDIRTDDRPVGHQNRLWREQRGHQDR